MFRKPGVNVHWRKSTNGSLGQPEKKLYKAYGTILELESDFKETGRNFIFIFLLNKTG
jgi:hypothetical protein